ncbi:MAG: hypothetical protein KY475_20995 [Planctomycetes bacterium]|nr:hypothetical protein [Planctomycetota bacterium]
MAEENRSPEAAEEMTLEKRLRGAVLTPRAAAELIAKLARIVEKENREGKSGGLTPESIILAADGSPTLTRSVSEEESRVESGSARDSSSLTLRVSEGAAYCAPEWDEDSDATAATEVYALGAILYACLTGRPPHLGTTPDETRRMSQQGTLIPPRVLRPDIPRPLETICLKCLRKNPDDRYSGAAALADDLQRYLEGRRIAASPAPLAIRMIGWTKRNRTAASIIALLLLGAFVAVGMVAWERMERTGERHAALAAHAQAVERMNSLAEEIPAAARALGGDDPQRAMRLLQSAADVFERLGNEGSTPPVLEGHGRLLNAAAEIYLQLNEPAQAEAAAERAVSINEQLVAQRPRHLTHRVALADSHALRGDALLACDAPDKAMADYRESEEILRRLTDRRPHELEYKHALSRTLSRLGDALWNSGHPADASAVFQEAFQLASNAAGGSNAPPERRRQLAYCHERLGGVLLALADSYDEREAARDHYQTALNIYEALASDASMPGVRRDVERIRKSLDDHDLPR